MKTKFFKLFWILLLVVSSFTLGYTLQPKSSKRRMPPFMNMQSEGNRYRMPPGMMAPPLNFPRR